MTRLKLFCVCPAGSIIGLVAWAGDAASQAAAGKDAKPGSFQFHNQKHGDLLRPEEANNADGTRIVLYPAHTYAGRGTYVARLTVTDNRGATGSASVGITVRRAPQLTGAWVTIPGTFTFTLEGETNATYVIQAAYDSKTWTNVLTLPNPDMPAEVTLPVGPGNPVLFWRAVMQ